MDSAGWIPANQSSSAGAVVEEVLRTEGAEKARGNANVSYQLELLGAVSIVAAENNFQGPNRQQQLNIDILRRNSPKSGRIGRDEARWGRQPAHGADKWNNWHAV